MSYNRGQNKCNLTNSFNDFSRCMLQSGRFLIFVLHLNSVSSLIDIGSSQNVYTFLKETELKIIRFTRLKIFFNLKCGIFVKKQSFSKLTIDLQKLFSTNKFSSSSPSSINQSNTYNIEIFENESWLFVLYGSNDRTMICIKQLFSELTRKNYLDVIFGENLHFDFRFKLIESSFMNLLKTQQ